MSVTDVAGETSATPAPAEAGRYGAFVSYSRVDSDLAHRLRAGLKARRIEAWLDVEGIVGGEAWMARIASAIEACNAFVLLVSPDSVASEYCARELTMARELGKLIVPVRWRDVDDRDLPPLLAGLDAVALRPGEDEASGLDRLAEVLLDDLPWRARHTRIAARARAWDGASRDPALVLVGSDLSKAEAWLGEQGDHRVAPTTAHGKYIVASRQEASRRQRTRLSWALAALGASALLAVVAVVARGHALAGKREALSRALAAQAVVVAERDPGLAAALSLEAERVEPTGIARGALEQVLPRMGEALGELEGHTGYVESVAVSPDGATIASASDDTTVRLWDRATHVAIGKPLRGHSELVWSVAFSPDGTLLASGSNDRTVRIWDVATRRQIGAPLSAPRGQRTGIIEVAFSPDGRTIAAATSGGTVRRWDVATHAPRGEALGEPDTSSLTSVAYSPDGRRLATAALDGTVRIWDTATSEAVGAPIAAHVGQARDVAFAPDGESLASGGQDGLVRLWDVATQRPRGAPFVVGAGSEQGVWSVAFAPDGTKLATSGDGGRLWDVATRLALAPALRDDAEGITLEAAFTPDGRTLVTASSVLRLWNVSAGARDSPLTRSWVPTIPTGQPGEAVLLAGGIVFAPGGRTIAIVDAKGALDVWDLTSRSEVGTRISLPRGKRIIRAAWRSDGRMFATAGEDGAVRLWSAATRRQLGAPLLGHVRQATSVAFSPDGRLVASTGQDSTVRLWSVRRRTGTTLGSHRGRGTAVAFSPDGRTLVSAGGEPRVLVWDVATRRRAGKPITSPGGATIGVAFSPGGRLVATGDLTGDVRLWDVATRARVGAAMRESGVVGLLAFSPDGETLATVGTGPAIRLWRVSTRRRVGPLLPHAPSIDGLAFSPDGTSLASSGSDLRVHLWDALLWKGDRAALRARACAAGRRNLSRAEWARYMTGEPYHKTCPAP